MHQTLCFYFIKVLKTNLCVDSGFHQKLRYVRQEIRMDSLGDEKTLHQSGMDKQWKHSLKSNN